jgi:hypothetical protein
MSTPIITPLPLFHLVMQSYGCLTITPNPNVSHFVSLFCIGIYGQCDLWRDKMDSGGRYLLILTARMITHGEGKSKSLIHTIISKGEKSWLR